MFRKMKGLSLLLAIILLFCLTSCIRYQTNYIEINGSTTGQTGVVPSGSAVLPTADYSQNIPTVPSTLPSVPESTTLPPADGSTAPSSSAPSTPASTEPAVKTPDTWTKEEVVQFLGNAVNKTKAYTNSIVVRHVESFTINIEEINPSIVKSLAQTIINGVLKPTDDTVTFTNGQGVISGNETVPLLLPKRQNFSLPAAGAATAVAKQDGANIVVDVQLVSEKATLSDHPVYNAGTTGYLDVGDVDLSMLTLEAFEVNYTGSTIHAVINPDGYVSYADYHMPVKIYAAGRALGFSASFRCSGEQQEQWTLNW